MDEIIFKKLLFCEVFKNLIISLLAGFALLNISKFSHEEHLFYYDIKFI
jgi:hypothetical protein